MIRRQGICLLLSALMVLSLCGCGQEIQETAGKTIELIEPVNVADDTEAVAYRNIYDFKVYPAAVYPTVTEYSFDKETEIESRGAFWGEEVKKGTALVYSSTEKVDKQIEDMQEVLAEMEEAMLEAETTLRENLAEPKEEEKRLADIVENFENNKPDEMIYASQLPPAQENPSDGGEVVEQQPDELVANPEYQKWVTESETWIGKYRIHAHNIDMQEEAMRQRRELYDLEHAYLMEQLQDLENAKKKSTITSTINGEVVAKIETGYETYKAAEEEVVIAVGDMENKVIKTDYINKTDISKAKDIYALIDGVRYEVEYQPMDLDEYTKITSDGGKAYTTFTLLGDCSQINVGDYAVLTVFAEKSEQVLAVPKEALHKDETGYFVYVMEGEGSVKKPVKTGVTDGVYTEIVSGVAEGDAVLVEKVNNYSTQTAQVEYGSFNSTFENVGMMYYSMSEAVTNPVEYGTVYFGEYQVAQYQHVEKGDVIATIRVMSDKISIQRNQVKLQRAQERLNDLIAAGEEENKKAIEAKQEEIAEISELLAEMERDSNTKQITAPKSGIIVSLADYETETILLKDSFVAEIAEESACYVVVENTNQLLNYGNEVTISYTNKEGKPAVATGMVANLANPGVSRNLQTEASYILLPKESIGEMSLYNNNRNNWWNRFVYDVEATIREMDNVLVVPRKAVTEINGCTYVNVMDEHGNITTRSFVAGGYDSSNYWVIEGLSEGMVLCLK